MKFNTTPQDWAQAKAFFLSNPLEKKYLPSAESIYYFIKTDKDEILALARKRHREQYTLGKGHFSLVVTAQSEADQLHACKLIIDPDHQMPEDHSVAVMERLNILIGQQTRPRHKIKTKIINEQEKSVNKKGYQIIKLAPGKTLHQILLDIKNKLIPALTSLQTDIIALKCCLALLAYHQLDIIHGDINKGNLHICFENNDIVVTFVDQGFSLLLAEGQQNITLTTARGTNGFAAPEIRSHCLYSFESDYYALGKIFVILQRPQWAQYLMAHSPKDRFNLYEILFLILGKIFLENQTLDNPHYTTFVNAKKIFIDYFQEKLTHGMPLGDLFKCRANLPLFYAHERMLIAVYCCQAYLKNLKPRIFGYDNFVITKKNGKISIAFDLANQKIDLSLSPPETRACGSYSEKSAVYSLGAIFNSLGIRLNAEMDPDPIKRPDILELIEKLCSMAKEIPNNPDLEDLSHVQSSLKEHQTDEDSSSDLSKSVSSSSFSASDYKQSSSDSSHSTNLGLVGHIEDINFSRPLLTQFHRKVVSSPALMTQYERPTVSAAAAAVISKPAG